MADPTSSLFPSLFPQSTGKQMTFGDLDTWFQTESKKITPTGDSFAQAGDLDEMLKNLGSRPQGGPKESLDDYLGRLGQNTRTDSSKSQTGVDRASTINKKLKSAKELLEWDTATSSFKHKYDTEDEGEAKRDAKGGSYTYRTEGQFYLQPDGSVSVKGRKEITRKPDGTIVDTIILKPYVFEMDGGTKKTLNVMPFNESEVLAKAGFQGEVNVDGSVKCTGRNRVVIQPDAPLYDLDTRHYYDTSTNSWKQDTAYDHSVNPPTLNPVKIKDTKLSDATAVMEEKDINFMPNFTDGTYSYNSRSGTVYLDKNCRFYDKGDKDRAPRTLGRNIAGIVTETQSPPFPSTFLIPKSRITPEFRGIVNAPRWSYTDPTNNKKYTVRFNDILGIIIAENGSDIKVFTKDRGWMNKVDYEKAYGPVPPATSDYRGPNPSSGGTTPSSTTPGSTTPTTRTARPRGL